MKNRQIVDLHAGSEDKGAESQRGEAGGAEEEPPPESTGGSNTSLLNATHIRRLTRLPVADGGFHDHVPRKCAFKGGESNWGEGVADNH